MKKNDDFQSLMESLAYYRGDSTKSEGFMKKFIKLWSSYGDKRFLGKKGRIMEDMDKIGLYFETLSEKTDSSSNSNKSSVHETEKVANRKDSEEQDDQDENPEVL